MAFQGSVINVEAGTVFTGNTCYHAGEIIVSEISVNSSTPGCHDIYACPDYLRVYDEDTQAEYARTECGQV